MKIKVNKKELNLVIRALNSYESWLCSQHPPDPRLKWAHKKRKELDRLGFLRGRLEDPLQG